MEAGEVISGKYRLNQLLGVGGMATVWSATNIYTEREFAIKLLLPNVGRTEEARSRFLMEAKVSARINHPNVIEIIDVGQTDDGSLFLVMELLTGLSLEAAVRRDYPPMTIYQLCISMLEVSRALAAAHKVGVVHRDLKPTNVFLHRGRDGHVVTKVLDFGVSKFLQGERSHSLTMAGTVLGSPMYMSPEQAIGSPNVDGRTDIFAFGSIMFEALVGYRCYEAPNFNALIVAIATREPKSIDACATHLPERLRALVRDTITTNRDQRIASFDEVAERLATLLPELEHDGRKLPPRTKNDSAPPRAMSSARRAMPSSPQADGSEASIPLVRHSPSSPPGRASASGSVTPPPAEAGARHAQRTGFYLVGGGALLSLAIVVGAYVVYRAPVSNVADPPPPVVELSATPAAAAPPSAAPSVAQTTADGGAELPVVNVDQLPVTAPRKRP
jgi:serine/threonine protein kinase